MKNNKLKLIMITVCMGLLGSAKAQEKISWEKFTEISQDNFSGDEFNEISFKLSCDYCMRVDRSIFDFAGLSKDEMYKTKDFMLFEEIFGPSKFFLKKRQLPNIC